jgi:formyltetrahydrofolate-dependent phosphoribosylglycinamide formyltransferase
MAERARVGVLISGRGSNMAALLYVSRLPDCPYEIVLVAANDPEAPGLALAAAEGVPTFAQSHKGLTRAAFDAIVDRELRAADVQYVALAGYMRLLSPEFVARWADRIVNVHPSLLPRYKGLDTHARAIEAGDRVAGCSVHVVTAELDDGPVLGQAEVAILPGDTPETLAARVLIAEHQLYPRALASFVAAATGPEALLARLRGIAHDLPETEEVVSHGMPAFRIAGGKMFAYFTRDHHGNGITAVLVKTSNVDEQSALIERDPDLYYRPAYFGPSGWIGIRLDQGPVDWEHIAERVGASWTLVAPRRLAAMLAF